MSAPRPTAPDDGDDVAATAALGDAEFAARLGDLGPFERRPRLAVAVSGGPDSLALTLLADRWARSRGGEILGLVVDHGLRAESAAEACRVEAWLHARGIGCRVLAWDGAKPPTGVQAAARAARHALLERACAEAGVVHLLLGHHAWDQAETAFMRAERSSGPAGRAGMAAIVDRPGLRLLRPLLAVRPARLRAVLQAAGQPWLEDPGNEEPRFRRVRLRGDQGFDRRAWLAAAAGHGAGRAAAERDLADFAAVALRPHPLGFLDLELAAWHGLPPTLAHLAVTRAILAVSGAAYPTSPAAAAGLRGRLGRPGDRVTLGGALLQVRRDRLLVLREPARVGDRRSLVPGDSTRWDGRFEIAYLEGPGPVTVRALGEAGRRLLPGSVRQEPRARGVPAAVLDALPSLWAGGDLLACPSLGLVAGIRDAPNCRASAKLLSRNVFAPASFAAPNVVPKHPTLI